MSADPSHSGSSPARAPPRPGPRWLGSALAATLVATAWLAWQDDGSEVIAPATRGRSVEGRAFRTANARPSPRASVAPWPEPISPRRPPPTSIDATAWGAPAVPAEVPPTVAQRRSAAPAAAERVAPTFAYTLIGKLDDGQQRALLTGPRRSLAVKVGDIVDEEWRVDAVRPDGVMLTWLPGNSQQQIGFKAS